MTALPKRSKGPATAPLRCACTILPGEERSWERARSPHFRLRLYTKYVIPYLHPPSARRPRARGGFEGRDEPTDPNRGPQGDRRRGFGSNRCRASSPWQDGAARARMRGPVLRRSAARARPLRKSRRFGGARGAAAGAWGFYADACSKRWASTSRPCTARFSPEFAKEIHGAEEGLVLGPREISAIAHPWNPNAPTAHMNSRFVVTSKFWFGGGGDLTPMLEASPKLCKRPRCDLVSPGDARRLRAQP